MADLNGNAQYAVTGLYKDYIAWIELGQAELNLLTTGSLTVENTIDGGYTVNFILSAKPYNNDPATSSIFTARPSDVGFGYLGKGTTYELLKNPYFAAGGTNFIISLNDIIVKKDGIPISNYAFVVGDAEITTSGEIMEFYSPDAAWEVIDLVKNHDPVESPILSGESTNSAVLTGVNYQTGTYILQSYNVKNLDVKTPNLSPAGVIGAFGIVVKMPPELTKIAMPNTVENAVGEYVKFKVTFTPTQSDLLSYRLVDTIQTITGLSYISLTSNNIPKTTITQNGNFINAVESINNNIVTFDIDSKDLTLNIPVEVELVYRLDNIIAETEIINRVSIEAQTPIGPTPKGYASAKVNLKRVNFPKIQKSPSLQEVLIENGKEVDFQIVISDFKYDTATMTYEIIDKLDNHLEFSNKSILSVNIGGVITILPLNATVDLNNILKIIIPAQDVPVNSILTLNLVTFLKNVDNIKNLDVILNQAQLIIDNNMDHSYLSNEVKVIFTNKCFLAMTDIVKSISLQEAALSHILNAEGEKIQRLLTLDNVSNSDLICINNSVTRIVDSIAVLESILSKKLKVANDAYKDSICKN